MKLTRFTLGLLLVAGFAGCATPSRDPLTGWKYLFHVGYSHFDKAVVDDYTAYIHSLSPEEVRVVDWYSIDEYEDSTGQHAVRIEAPVNGVYREHVLIYDKSNKRIKVVTYSGGRYRS